MSFGDLTTPVEPRLHPRRTRAGPGWAVVRPDEPATCPLCPSVGPRTRTGLASADPRMRSCRSSAAAASKVLVPWALPLLHSLRALGLAQVPPPGGRLLAGAGASALALACVGPLDAVAGPSLCSRPSSARSGSLCGSSCCGACCGADALACWARPDRGRRSGMALDASHPAPQRGPRLSSLMLRSAGSLARARLLVMREFVLCCALLGGCLSASS